jgi:hypothetical protein
LANENPTSKSLVDQNPVVRSIIRATQLATASIAPAASLCVRQSGLRFIQRLLSTWFFLVSFSGLQLSSMQLSVNATRVVGVTTCF